MAENLIQDNGASALDAAIQRLDNALAALESKITHRAAYGEQEDDLFETDRARLAAELDAARTRERALQDVAAEASAALGRAAAEVRAALSAEEG